MTEKEPSPSRWQAFMSTVRKFLLRRRKVLLVVMWVARLAWRITKLLLGNDPWTFYASQRR